MGNLNAKQTAACNQANIDAKTMAAKSACDQLKFVRDHLIVNYFVNGLLSAYKQQVMASNDLNKQFRAYAIELKSIAGCTFKQPEASTSQTPVTNDTSAISNSNNQQRSNNNWRGNQSNRGYQNNGSQGGLGSQN